MENKLFSRTNNQGLEKSACCNGQVGTIGWQLSVSFNRFHYSLPQGASAAAAPTRSMLLIVRKISQDSTEPPINDACQKKVSLSAILKVNINIKCNNLK